MAMRPAAGTGGLLAIRDYVAGGLLVLAGSALQGYANGTVDSLLVGTVFLFIGFALVKLVFAGKGPEQRAFLLTYGICVLVGGLAQCYSLMTFGEPQSTTDAVNSFFPEMAPAPPWTTWADLHPDSARLAYMTWQQVYKLTWLLGCKFGPYTAVMFNALVMGLTGSITVATARELFGDDLWRLRRVGFLFAFCGLFILFGAVLLRDCFTTFFNALVLWGLFRWLVRPTAPNLLFASATTGVSAYAILYLRDESVVMFGFFAFLAFVFYVLRERFKPVVLIAALGVLSALVIAAPYVLGFLSTSRDYQSDIMERFAARGGDSADSLARELIINQPLPIRLVVGSGSLLIFPMPLWGYLESGVREYHLIKTWHGLYQVFIIPLVGAGYLAAVRLFRRDRKRAALLMFLVAYLFLNWLAVVATSLEQRHIAQFMPAFLILAAVPDTRDYDTRRKVRRIAIYWFALVALLHLAWIALKAV